MPSHPHQQHLVRYGAGEPIFREGESGATLYLITSGRVRLSRAASGAEVELGQLERGECFGEASVLEGVPRTATAVALDACELLEIDAGALDKMIRGNPEIAVRLLRKMSQRLRELERRSIEAAREAPRLREGPPGGLGSPGARGASRSARQAASRSGPRLETEGGPVFPITTADCAIGRYDPVTELRPEIDLGGIDLKRSVARAHARIVSSSDGFALCADAVASAETRVNDEPVPPGQSRPLADGDRLCFGTVRAVFRS